MSRGPILELAAYYSTPAVQGWIGSDSDRRIGLTLEVTLRVHAVAAILIILNWLRQVTLGRPTLSEGLDEQHD